MATNPRQADSSFEPTTELNQNRPGIEEERGLGADQFFTLSQRVPIQVFNEETRLQKVRKWGPIVTGVASLVLTGFVWAKTVQLTQKQVDIQTTQADIQKQQLELQKQQTRTESERVDAELADMRFKFLADLTAKDETKTTSAEIALAAHGLKAFPVVHYALGVEQGDIHYFLN